MIGVGTGVWPITLHGAAVGASPAQTVVFLVAGQSNATARAPFDSGADWPTDGSVLQVGRSAAPLTSNTDEAVINAARPLDHVSQSQAGGMGFALQFSLDYLAANPSNTLVLVPVGANGTSFAANFWNQGDTWYEDAKDRVNTLLAANPSYVFGGILWHQGESDGDNITEAMAYPKALDDFVADIRSDITAASASTPIVMGGIGTFYTGSNKDRGFVQSVIENAADRLGYVAYASSAGLTDLGDSTHFDAASFRTFGSRYYTALGSATSAAPTPGAGAESGAVGHWLFGSDNTSHADLIKGATLYEYGSTPTLSTGYLSLTGRKSGMLSQIPDNANITVCMAIRVDDLGNVILGGNLRPSDGGMSPFVYASGIAMQDNAGAGLLGPETVTTDSWLFVAMSRASGGTVTFFVGGDGSNQVDTASGGASSPETRNIALGDVHYDNASFAANFDCAEFMVFHSAKSEADLEAIFARSATRLSGRSVTLLGP